MPTIEFLSDDKYIEVEQGESILQASLRAGIAHTHVCGGKARCTTCRIILLDGDEVKLSPPYAKEIELADKFCFTPNIRLTCQAHVIDNIDLTMMLMSDEGKVASSGLEKKLAILFCDIRDFTSFLKSNYPMTSFMY